MTKCASLKKVHTLLSSWKEILSWMILDFSVNQQKHALTCPGLYRLIFQSLYHTSLISPSSWEIDETVNFRNFRKLFTNKFSTFSGYFGTLFSNRKNETKWQGCTKILVPRKCAHAPNDILKNCLKSAVDRSCARG